MLSPNFIILGVGLVGFSVANISYRFLNLWCLFLLLSVLCTTKFPNFVFLSFLSLPHLLLSLEDEIIKGKLEQVYTI